MKNKGASAATKLRGATPIHLLIWAPWQATREKLLVVAEYMLKKDTENSSLSNVIVQKSFRNAGIGALYFMFCKVGGQPRGWFFLGMVPESWILIFKETISLLYMLCTRFTCNLVLNF